MLIKLRPVAGDHLLGEKFQRLVIPFVYLYNLIDAWKGANAINQRFIGGRTEPEEDSAIESPNIVTRGPGDAAPPAPRAETERPDSKATNARSSLIGP